MDPNRDRIRSRESVAIIGAILAIGLVLANIHSIYGLLASALAIGNTGIVKSPNINVYKESQCINEVSSLDWGFMDPGTSKNMTIYVNNTGNVPLTLHMSTENWSPQNAETYLELSWDYAGGQIQPNEVIAVTFTLTISENVEGITDFSFDILIIGTEAT